MATFKDAIVAGLNAAKLVEVHKKEIEGVLTGVRDAVLAATNGVIAIQVQKLSGHPSDLLMGLATFFKRDPEYGLVIRNLAFPQLGSVVIAQWKPSPVNGYPCGIVFERNEFTCHDKESLESTLLQILASASVGVEISKLASERPSIVKPKNAAGGGAAVPVNSGQADTGRVLAKAAERVAARSVAKSAAKPAMKAAAKPAAKPRAKVAAKPAAKAAMKPAARPAAKAAAKPAAKAAMKPAAKPAVKRYVNH